MQVRRNEKGIGLINVVGSKKGTFGFGDRGLSCDSSTSECLTSDLTSGARICSCLPSFLRGGGQKSVSFFKKTLPNFFFERTNPCETTGEGCLLCKGRSFLPLIKQFMPK